MPHFMLKGKFSHESVKALTANPQIVGGTAGRLFVGLRFAEVRLAPSQVD